MKARFTILIFTMIIFSPIKIWGINSLVNRNFNPLIKWANISNVKTKPLPYISPAQSQSFTYTAFAIIKNGDFGEVYPSTNTVYLNTKSKTITVVQSDGKKDVYYIKSNRHEAVTSSGNYYFTYLTTSGKYQFYCAFFQNKLIITNNSTGNGLVLYK